MKRSFPANLFLPACGFHGKHSTRTKENSGGVREKRRKLPPLVRSTIFSSRESNDPSRRKAFSAGRVYRRERRKETSRRTWARNARPRCACTSGKSSAGYPHAEKEHVARPTRILRVVTRVVRSFARDETRESCLALSSSHREKRDDGCRRSMTIGILAYPTRIRSRTTRKEKVS